MSDGPAIVLAILFFIFFMVGLLGISLGIAKHYCVEIVREDEQNRELQVAKQKEHYRQHCAPFEVVDTFLYGEENFIVCTNADKLFTIKPLQPMP